MVERPCRPVWVQGCGVQQALRELLQRAVCVQDGGAVTTTREIPELTDVEFLAFRGRCDFFSAGGCWEWAGGISGNGYGHFVVQRDGRIVNLATHRLSYTLTFGAIPAGLCVLHRCDNKPCVRPSHLFLGTIQDNVRDQQRKGRKGRGEAGGNAKLTNAQALEIRSELAAGVSQHSLGRRFGVSRSTVDLIGRRVTFSHI